MAKSGQEVVYEGWLTKSPPTKRIWRAKWRRRWFSLKHSGEIPDQFILTYYADRNCRKLKGSINLDDCEQVDLGLKIDKRNLKFDHVFDIKTPSRTYYLAAETESEMKSWVNCICKVCGLKSTSDEEDMPVSDNTLDNDVDFCEEKDDKHDVPNNQTPPVSPVSTSPYIKISDCITGKTPIYNSQDFKTLLQQNLKNSLLKSDYTHTHTNQTYGISQHHNYLNYVNDIQDPRFYDQPRLLGPANHLKKPEESESKPEKNSPLQSPTDTDSVFTDDDIGDVYVKQKFTRSNMKKPQEKTTAPPRPPKTIHMPPSTYINLNVQPATPNNQEEKPILTDDMYDFPRSHPIIEAEAVRNMLQKRHCYNNAAPGKVEGQVFRYDISPKPSTSNQVFTYDVEDIQDEPASPLSQTSSTTAYSNLPSPLLIGSQAMPPPAVNRDLKPKRKLSDTLSSSSNPEPSSPRGAPSVDRKLKPPTPLQDAHNRKSKVSPTLSTTRKTLSVDKHEDEVRKRGAPSPTPPGLARSHESLLSQQEEQIYHYLPTNIQYLDLDLDCGSNLSNSTNTMPLKSSVANTVYKKVDFEKTEAFNLTKNNLEKERKEPVTYLKK